MSLLTYRRRGAGFVLMAATTGYVFLHGLR